MSNLGVSKEITMSWWQTVYFSGYFWLSGGISDKEGSEEMYFSTGNPDVCHENLMDLSPDFEKPFLCLRVINVPPNI